jgi:hypothetical protein
VLAEQAVIAAVLQALATTDCCCRCNFVAQARGSIRVRWLEATRNSFFTAVRGTLRQPQPEATTDDSSITGAGLPSSRGTVRTRHVAPIAAAGVQQRLALLFKPHTTCCRAVPFCRVCHSSCAGSYLPQQLLLQHHQAASQRHRQCPLARTLCLRLMPVLLVVVQPCLWGLQMALQAWPTLLPLPLVSQHRYVVLCH